jgi:hypothetical protein
LGFFNWPVIYYIFPRQLGTEVFCRRCRVLKKKLSHHHHRAINKFLGAVAGEERRLLQGEFRTHILYFVLSFALLYFYLHRFIKNPKKLVSLIVDFTCMLLVLLEWLLLRTPSCVILLALIIVILSALLLRHLLLLQIFMRLSLLC